MRYTINKNFNRPAEEETEQPRRRKKRRNSLRLMVRVVLVIGLILCVYALLVNWKDIAPDRFVSWVQDVVNGTAGGTWPVSMSGNTVTDMEEVGGNIVLLTDNATVYYNTSGGESVRRTYAYAKPLMKTNDRYVLLMETSGKRFRLETRTDVELEMAVTNNICTGAVSCKGDVAIVTDSSQSHVSEVVVYSRKGHQRYQWYSSEWLVMDVSFSKDGNSLAAVACRTQSGAMQSAIIVLDLRGREDTPKQYTGDNVLYTSVQYMNSGTVVAVGDRQARFVNPTGALDVVAEYTEQELIGFSFGANELALVTRPYGSQENGVVSYYSSSGDQRSSQEFDGVFLDIAPKNKTFLLLTEDAVTEVTASGLGRQGAVPSDSMMTGAIGNQPLVLGLTTLSEAAYE